MVLVDSERKITKIGNSLGITLTDACKEVGLQLGDSVSVEVNPTTNEIIIKKNNKVTLPDGVGADFVEALKETIAEYDVTFKLLKDR
jgi:antitoxin MazE